MNYRLSDILLVLVLIIIIILSQSSPYHPLQTSCTHMVTMGDTLNSVASRYRTTPNALSDMNHSIGLKLFVYGSMLNVPCPVGR